MARSRQSKEEVLAELTTLLNDSKLTVFAHYSGLSVASMQELRRSASESNTRVFVAKNRLVKIAASKVDHLKDVDLSELNGQLVYAFNSEDEVAPAQSLNTFAKNNPELEFVGAINSDGEVFSAEQVKALAGLPSKDQLRGQLIGTIAAPLSGFVSVLSGNMRGLVNVLNARQAEIDK